MSSITNPEISVAGDLNTSPFHNSNTTTNANPERRTRADSSSSPSIASADGDRLAPEHPSRRRLRASFDGAVEQLHSQRRRGKAVAKRWAGRGLGVDDDAKHDRLLETQSLRHPSPASSLQLPPMERKRTRTASDPGPTESGPSECPDRSSLSPHESRSDSLTASSPFVATSDATAPVSLDTSANPDDSATSNNLATTRTDTLEAPSPDRQRSPSPVGKLKDALKSGRRPSTPRNGSDSDSSKRGTLGSGAGGGGFSAIVGSRKGTFSRKGLTSESASTLERPGTAPSGSLFRSATTTPSKITANIPSTPTINIVEAAPSTVVTPPTPTNRSQKKSGEDDSSAFAPKIEPPAPAARRRGKSTSAIPSKLPDNVPPSSSSPLTPHLEEVVTPGGGLINPASGFLSSVFSAAQSAAQTAATSITNTIGNVNIVPGQRKLNPPVPDSNTGESGGEEVIFNLSGEQQLETPGERRPLAIETLGLGNLSLSHLGIAESTSEVGPSSSTTLMDSLAHVDEANAKAEDSAVAKAISAAYKDKATGEKSGTNTPVQRSRANTSFSEDVPLSARSQTFDVDGTYQNQNGHPRTGSIRSRVSSRRRRHRNSSATTGGTIAAAIGATTSALVNPGLQPSGPRLTGFAVANPKRNRDFHQLFRSVPEDDYLIEDYSAALQREILLQGRIYISEGHICFSSNILGWVTNLVISYDEVVSVEKKSTAVIFPNAIVIQTLHSRNVFASLVSRDTTYDLIINIWKITHPNLKSSLNGVTLGSNSGTGDKTEKADSLESDDESISGSDDGSDDEFYDEDADDVSDDYSGDGRIAAADRSFTPLSAAPSDTGTTMTGVDTLAAKSDATVIRKPSAAVPGESGAERGPKNLSGGEGPVAAANGAAGGPDSPGPATHAPTDCGDGDAHYDKQLIDTVIPAPLGKVYSLLFGPNASSFMRRWLAEDQKCLDIQIEEDKKGLGDDQKTNGYSYIKPLYASIGPRQTKCVISQSLEQFDLEKAVTVLCSTQNPDVPSGNVFVVKTRYCLMWAPNNGTRMIMNFTVEWSGKSWLKGPIEKNAHDGQVNYAKDLAAALRTAVASSKSLKPSAGGKGRRKRKGSPTAERVAPTPPPKTARSQSSSFPEPFRTVFDTARMLGTPGVIVGLALAVVYLWLRVAQLQNRVGDPLALEGLQGRPGLSGGGDPARVAAYEQLWRQEESGLWEWLEKRVGSTEGADATIGRVRRRREEGLVKGMEARMKKGGVMEGREMEEALRVTRERLEALEEAVRRRNGEGTVKEEEK